MHENDDLVEPDLDALTRGELAELDGPAATVAGILDEWLRRLHGITSGQHGAGLFLDLLAAEGWRVERIQVPPWPFATPAGPVTVHYWPAAPTPEQAESAKQAVLETAAEVAREQQGAGQRETCCVCGSPQVGYHNYRNQPFCRPCADGEPPLQVVHVVRTEGPTSEVFAGPFVGDEAQAWIEANRTDKWTMCQVATLERPAVIPEREEGE